MDSYTGHAISDGKVVDVFGVPMHPRLAHLFRNLRLINELDQLNPGDAWIKVGKGAGHWTDKRPHRYEAPEGSRWLRVLTGINAKGIIPEKQQLKNMHEAAYEANKSKGKMRLAMRNGQVLEVSEDHAVIQVLELTSDLDVAATKIRLEEDVARLGVSTDMIGRVFNGYGTLIVSTSEGVTTGRKALEKKVGGELICSVW